MAVLTIGHDSGFIERLRARRGHEPRAGEGETLSMLSRRLRHMEGSGGLAAVDVERMLGRNDLVRINYLARGLMAARPVCRLRIGAAFGGGGDWGTGFLVGPQLLLTNHHVLETPDEALRSVAEFGYESDVRGQLLPSKRFTLRPDLVYFTDPTLDFTLVGVSERSDDGLASTADYGFLRLFPETSKVGEGEFVTIIQHPNGDEKFIAVRENKVLKIGDETDPARDGFLWYASDTAPGSSGAPAFNDSWQVVAIHHGGVPVSRGADGRIEYQLMTGEWVPKEQAEQLGDTRIKWIANEGVRISRIFAKIAELYAKSERRSELVKAFLDDAMGVKTYDGSLPRESLVGPPVAMGRGVATESAPFVAERARGPSRNLRALEYYAGRRGYDPDFLRVSVPLPAISSAALQFGRVAEVRGATDGVLRYTHFSVVYNADRRMAFFTAVNIDGKRWTNLSRGVDQWFYDPRLPLEIQVGDEMYGNEPAELGRKGWFDRGHLVRRMDPDWGAMPVAQQADEDTFHWTNCSPQYWGFNQGKQLWAGLEDYVLFNTDQEDVRASVFSGPIFADDDEEHRGVRIPKFFWKVVAVVDGDDRLYSSAYVVSQEKYARDIPFEVLPVGDFNHFQVPLTKLEARTGLRFPQSVGEADVLAGQADRPLRALADIAHPRRNGRSPR
jgi:endonuclease G